MPAGTVDTLSCPACHRALEPELRRQSTAYTSYTIRVRCGGCGRLWKGDLRQVDEGRIHA